MKRTSSFLSQRDLVEKRAKTTANSLFGYGFYGLANLTTFQTAFVSPVTLFNFNQFDPNLIAFLQTVGKKLLWDMTRDTIIIVYTDYPNNHSSETRHEMKITRQVIYREKPTDVIFRTLSSEILEILETCDASKLEKFSLEEITMDSPWCDVTRVNNFYDGEEVDEDDNPTELDKIPEIISRIGHSFEGEDKSFWDDVAERLLELQEKYFRTCEMKVYRINDRIE